MDYRCPHCGHDLAKRKLAFSVIAKMEVDCPGCKRRLTMNIHGLESSVTTLVALGFVGTLLAGIMLENRTLVGAGIVIGLAGGVATLLVERVVLRGWPRYLPKEPPAAG
jgi:hypothetical protein